MILYKILGLSRLLTSGTAGDLQYPEVFGSPRGHGTGFSAFNHHIAAATPGSAKQCRRPKKPTKIVTHVCIEQVVGVEDVSIAKARHREDFCRSKMDVTKPRKEEKSKASTKQARQNEQRTATRRTYVQIIDRVCFEKTCGKCIHHTRTGNAAKKIVVVFDWTMFVVGFRTRSSVDCQSSSAADNTSPGNCSSCLGFMKWGSCVLGACRLRPERRNSFHAHSVQSKLCSFGVQDAIIRRFGGGLARVSK